MIKIGFACDHAGYELKLELIKFITELNYNFEDFGTNSTERCDYPDFAHPLAVAIENGECEFGVSICGSGNGINMTVNKHEAIRGALCWNTEISQLARLHNDANICALPARFISLDLAKEILLTFLTTKFEAGRHINRINKIPLSK